MTKENFQKVMLTYLHRPYIWGGDDPILGFDCSGLVQELLAIIGMDPDGDQTAQALYNHFSKRKFSTFGDTGTLVFYGKSEKEITHVAMLFDRHTIIEAGGGNSKTITPIDARNQNAFVRLRHINKRKDIVAAIRPIEMLFEE